MHHAAAGNAGNRDAVVAWFESPRMGTGAAPGNVTPAPGDFAIYPPDLVTQIEGAATYVTTVGVMHHDYLPDVSQHP
jgi:hypothetical protein